MKFQETKNALVEAGFEFHMLIATTEHYWKENIRVSISPYYFEVACWLFSFTGCSRCLKAIGNKYRYISFIFNNGIEIKVPTGGGE